jgi:hypothetical protein
MKGWRARASARETILVAAALLLPIPLFAQSGLSVPLPGVVERGLGSLVTLEAVDDRSDTTATARASENGRGTGRSATGSLKIDRGGKSPARGPISGADVDSTASKAPADETGSGGAGSPPAGADPEGAGDGGAGSPGSPESPGTQGDDTGSGSDAGTGDGPELTLTADGQAASVGATVSPGGVSVEIGADNGGSDDGASAGVEVTDEDGRRTGLGTGLPGIGVAAP